MAKSIYITISAIPRDGSRDLLFAHNNPKGYAAALKLIIELQSAATRVPEGIALASVVAMFVRCVTVDMGVIYN